MISQQVSEKLRRGQSMTEYVILVTVICAATMIGLAGLGSHPGLIEYVGDFYLRVARLVSIPFP